MKKLSKAAIAASAAAVLLLGGAGSLAFWTSTGTVTGGALDTGHLSLDPAPGTDCATATWTYDAAGGGGTYTPGTSLLVPGDVITKTCSFVLNATGDHMSGTFSVATPDITPAGDADNYAVAASATDGGAPLTTFTEANNGDTIAIAISVTFTDPGTADNSSQDLTDTLADLTVVATQAHP